MNGPKDGMSYRHLLALLGALLVTIGMAEGGWTLLAAFSPGRSESSCSSWASPLACCCPRLRSWHLPTISPRCNAWDTSRPTQGKTA